MRRAVAARQPAVEQADLDDRDVPDRHLEHVWPLRSRAHRLWPALHQSQRQRHATRRGGNGSVLRQAGDGRPVRPGGAADRGKVSCERIAPGRSPQTSCRWRMHPILKLRYGEPPAAHVARGWPGAKASRRATTTPDGTGRWPAAAGELYRCPPASGGRRSVRFDGEVEGKGRPVRHGKTLAVGGRAAAGRSTTATWRAESALATTPQPRTPSRGKAQIRRAVPRLRLRLRLPTPLLRNRTAEECGRAGRPRGRLAVSTLRVSHRISLAREPAGVVCDWVDAPAPTTPSSRAAKRRGDPEEKPLDCRVGFASSQ